MTTSSARPSSDDAEAEVAAAIRAGMKEKRAEEESEEAGEEEMEHQKKALAELSSMDDFDGLVRKLMKEGKSKEYATKIAGKVANEQQGKDSSFDSAEIARVICAEAAQRRKLYNRLVPVVGAFDHDEMTLPDMAAHALKQLNLPTSKNPVVALEFYLEGRVQSGVGAMDAASSAHFVKEYLAW
jgi:hypothetical protein